MNNQEISNNITWNRILSHEPKPMKHKSVKAAFATIDKIKKRNGSNITELSNLINQARHDAEYRSTLFKNAQPKRDYGLYLKRMEDARTAADNLEELEQERDELLNELLPPDEAENMIVTLLNDYKKYESITLNQLREHLTKARDLMIELYDETSHFEKAASEVRLNLSSRQSLEAIDKIKARHDPVTHKIIFRYCGDLLNTSDILTRIIRTL